MRKMPNKSSLNEKRDQLYNEKQFASTVLEPKINENKNKQTRMVKSVNFIDIRQLTSTSAKSSDDNGEGSSNNTSRQGSRNYRTTKKRSCTGKSTLILIVIVVFFVITHSNRLALKVYMTIFPHLNTKENFIQCLGLGR